MSRSRIETLAELARVSNLPTVWSNVIVGTMIASLDAPPWGRIGLTALAMSALYVAGMILNDVVDREIDEEERPDRPIPSGRVSVRSAVALAATGFVVGLALMLPFGWEATAATLGLIVVIVAYDFLHKATPIAAVLMGACRGLVYVAAAFASGGRLDATTLVVYAAALAVYTTILTNLARDEVSQSDRASWTPWLLVLPVAFPLILGTSVSAFWPVVTGVAFAVWTRSGARAYAERPPRVRDAVLTWIAGFALVDLFFLTLLGHPTLGILALMLFFMTLRAHRRILGT